MPKNNLKSFKTEIENATKIAISTPEEGIIANLYAMMNRPDFSESLKNSRIPFLHIAGKKDNYIDYDSVIPKILFRENSELCVLEKSGHMGFIEEKELSLVYIENFISNKYIK